MADHAEELTAQRRRRGVKPAERRMRKQGIDKDDGASSVADDIGDRR